MLLNQPSCMLQFEKHGPGAVAVSAHQSVFSVFLLFKEIKEGS